VCGLAPGRRSGPGRKDSTVFERLNTPQELFSFKLGAALKMENTVL
jgi:hypothetical protein